MTPINKNIPESSYTYEKSDVVPDWVSKLDDLKSKIKAQLHPPESGKNVDVEFCHPINVPAPKK